jgi:hypothetical protein
MIALEEVDLVLRPIGARRTSRWRRTYPRQRDGDRALACDLRMRPVHLLRDAAHSPDARASLLQD